MQNKLAEPIITWVYIISETLVHTILTSGAFFYIKQFLMQQS